MRNATDETGQSATAYFENAAIEAAVLKTVFYFEHPVTLEEVIQHLGAFTSDSSPFAERDAFEMAARELVGASLLNHTNDDLLLPTRAAHKFAELTEF